MTSLADMFWNLGAMTEALIGCWGGRREAYKTVLDGCDSLPLSDLTT